MSLSLNNIYQRPYLNQNGRNMVKRKEDEEKSSSANLQREESQNENSRSRGLQNQQEPRPSTYRPNYNQSFSVPGYENVNIHRAQQPQVQNPIQQQIQTNQAPVAQVNQQNSINKNDSNINIAQVLLDLKNTSLAISAPDDIMEDVNAYINLVEHQVKSGNPNKEIVKSNLKNAATLLDGYISQTLNKDSKVVYNWIDTIFLQRIDFNYDENSINERFLVQFPDGTTSQTRKAQAQNNEEKKVAEVKQTKSDSGKMSEDKHQIVPTDERLKALFLRGKRLAYALNPEKAIPAFGQALERASEIGDTETAGKIYYEVGKIYDENDYLPQALKSYNQTIMLAKDKNIKTKAHYSMAQIYDEANDIHPALDHYYSAISYAGETENYAAQSKSLTKIGNIHTDMYDKDAFEFYDLAQSIADQTDNYNLRGYVDTYTGKAYQKFDEGEMALKSYSYATQNYIKGDSPDKTAVSYILAADLMVEFGKLNKARNLLNKSMTHAQKAENTTLMNEINLKLKELERMAA